MWDWAVLDAEGLVSHEVKSSGIVNMQNICARRGELESQ